MNGFVRKSTKITPYIAYPRTSDTTEFRYQALCAATRDKEIIMPQITIKSAWNIYNENNPQKVNDRRYIINTTNEKEYGNLSSSDDLALKMYTTIEFAEDKIHDPNFIGSQFERRLNFYPEIKNLSKEEALELVMFTYSNKS